MFVGADAERSCSRRRSVTDAACPSRVLIGPLLQFCIALSFLNVGADDSVRPQRPPLRQKKPAPFRFRRGGENSISAAFFFLSKPEPFHWVPVWLTNGGCRQRRLGEFLKPFFSFSCRERKERFQSSKKRKRAVQNRNCKPCRHRARRKLLRFASAGMAKAPHPHPPSSFPNCDRFTGSQFGSWKFYNAARDLDDGAQTTFTDTVCKGCVSHICKKETPMASLFCLH